MSIAEQGVSHREHLLSRYFREIPARPTHQEATRFMMGAGGLLVLAALSGAGSSAGFSGLVLGLAFGAGALVLLYKGVVLRLREKYDYQKAMIATFPQPSDREVDRWLQDGLDRIRSHSREKLELTTEECDDVDLPPIVGAVLSYQAGVAPEDLVSKAGQDGLARFGVYEVSILWLAEEHLGIFTCTYSLIRDAILNERTHEFFYRDIISVATREQSSSVSLPTGESLTSVEEFRISVANDQHFSTIVGSGQLKKLTGAERMPDNGCEKVLRILRTKLRAVKATIAS